MSIFNPTTIIKDFDMFGKAPNIRFKGQDKFKTFCGGLATMFLILCLSLYFGINGYSVYAGRI